MQQSRLQYDQEELEKGREDMIFDNTFATIASDNDNYLVCVNMKKKMMTDKGGAEKRSKERKMSFLLQKLIDREYYG